MRHITLSLAILCLLTASCTPVSTVPPKRPFQLTHDEEQSVDRLLARWEQWNAGVKTFDCRFKRWTYDSVFGSPNQPRYVEFGSLKYAAPDRCLYYVGTAEKDGREVPIDDSRAEHWAFDGKSIIEWNHTTRQIIERKLPSNLKGTRLVDGPLTFPYWMLGWFYLGGQPSEPTGPVPFSAKAEDLKRQYYVREISPASKPKDQIWLEAYPRSARMAACFQQLQVIFRASDMSPVAMKLVQPNGKDYVVYQFYDVAVNVPPPPGSDPFHPPAPYGWQKKTAEAPPPGVSLFEPHIGAP
jgi:TIGR03009 family protein